MAAVTELFIENTLTTSTSVASVKKKNDERWLQNGLAASDVSFRYSRIIPGSASHKQRQLQQPTTIITSAATTTTTGTATTATTTIRTTTATTTATTTTTNNNPNWRGSVSTSEETPPHSWELMNHALSQVGGPTQSQLSRPMSSGHHISMEHRRRRKQRQLNSDTDASNEIHLEEKRKEETVFEKN